MNCLLAESHDRRHLGCSCALRGLAGWCWPCCSHRRGAVQGTAGSSHHHHASVWRPLCTMVGDFCTARGFKNMLLFPLKGSRVHSNPAGEVFCKCILSKERSTWGLAQLSCSQMGCHTALRFSLWPQSFCHNPIYEPDFETLPLNFFFPFPSTVKTVTA